MSVTHYYAKQSTKFCQRPDDSYWPVARFPRTTFTAVIIHIATGSNLGTRIDHLDRADAELGRLGRVLRISPTYETAAVGMAPGTPDFLNRVVEVELDPAWADNPEGTMQVLLHFDHAVQEVGRAMGHAHGGGLVGGGDPEDAAEAAEFGIGLVEVVDAGSEVGSGGDVDNHGGKGRVRNPGHRPVGIVRSLAKFGTLFCIVVGQGHKFVLP